MDSATPNQPPSDPPAPQQSVCALLSLIGGILCLAIPGLILGIVALQNIKKSGGAYVGRTMAIWGIVLSSIGLLLSVAAILASLGMPAYGASQQKLHRLQSLELAKLLYVAQQMFAADREGEFAPDWQTLIEGNYLEEGLQYSRHTNQNEPPAEYVLLLQENTTDTSPANQPLIRDPFALGGNVVVVTIGGAAKIIPESKAPLIP
ncbi:MAG: DUF4190 domain-containing protein [Verrucomicrobiota bacterium]